MALTHEDRTAVTDLIAMHGHLVDSGRFDLMDELFTPDATYDVTDFGQPPLHGLAAVREAALALGDRNPLGHHVTNTVLTELADGRIRALSKGIGITTTGTCGTVTYDDTVTRTPAGWRITHRRVLAHRTPLGLTGLLPAADGHTFG
ncbi:nuclear transport factor 2 family protein [Actinacidiphila paucisporea]|uniref:SnoaL-like domain-containing protein n=1 Tax=Actinacidiphila paucisporea TaxID=310782 RepID=A0A1M6TKT2_9ACTN|nr:nuclear transport factor 2 family protein [Actinacidiphila paucisporea]SHK57534.1 SnoaL-like domain-containing protein [Actinacidiphila paucisporea]